MLKRGSTLATLVVELEMVPHWLRVSRVAIFDGVDVTLVSRIPVGRIVLALVFVLKSNQVIMNFQLLNCLELGTHQRLLFDLYYYQNLVAAVAHQSRQ